MDNAIFIGLSRQQTLRRELDVVANNISNIDTAGFKVESLMVREEPRQTAPTGGGQGPLNFVYDDGVARDFTQGTLRTTGATFDIGLEGKGFFAVKTPDGDRYTRDGRFGLRDDGTLVNADGYEVMDANGAALKLDPKKGAVAISPDGIVSQDGVRTGKLGAVTFEDTAALEKMGGNLFRNTSNGAPVVAAGVQIRQGMLEASNVNGVAEISRMIEVSRAYESVTKLMNDIADLSRRSVERMGAVS